MHPLIQRVEGNYLCIGRGVRWNKQSHGLWFDRLMLQRCDVWGSPFVHKQQDLCSIHKRKQTAFLLSILGHTYISLLEEGEAGCHIVLHLQWFFFLVCSCVKPQVTRRGLNLYMTDQIAAFSEFLPQDVNQSVDMRISCVTGRLLQTVLRGNANWVTHC